MMVPEPGYFYKSDKQQIEHTKQKDYTCQSLHEDKGYETEVDISHPNMQPARYVTNTMQRSAS
jgi:hypothetical protein